MYSVLFHLLTNKKLKNPHYSFETNESIDFLIENIESMSTDEFINVVNKKIDNLLIENKLTIQDIKSFISGMTHRFDTLIYPYTEWSMVEGSHIVENCNEEYEFFREAIDDLLIETIEFIKKDLEEHIVFVNRLLDEKVVTITSETIDVQVRSDKVVQEIKYKVISNPEFHN